MKPSTTGFLNPSISEILGAFHYSSTSFYNTWESAPPTPALHTAALPAAVVRTPAMHAQADACPESLAAWKEVVRIKAERQNIPVSDVWYGMLPKHDSGKTAVHRFVSIFSVCLEEMNSCVVGKRSKCTVSATARKHVREFLEKAGWKAKHLDMYVGQALGMILDDPSLWPAIDYMLKAASELEARPTVVSYFRSALALRTCMLRPGMFTAALRYVRRCSSMPPSAQVTPGRAVCYCVRRLYARQNSGGVRAKTLSRRFGRRWTTTKPIAAPSLPTRS